MGGAGTASGGERGLAPPLVYALTRFGTDARWDGARPAKPRSATGAKGTCAGGRLILLDRATPVNIFGLMNRFSVHK